MFLAKELKENPQIAASRRDAFMQPHILKLIAILIPDPVAILVKAEQQYIADHFGPKHALRTPPHITLIPPLEVNNEEIKKIVSIGKEISTQIQSFKLELNGFGTFKPRVVFIKIMENKLLNDLYRLWRSQLEQHAPHLLARYPDRPYHPHLTLAHRDVTPHQFDAIWKYYEEKSFELEIEITGSWMLKHSSSGWEREMEFKFDT